MLDTLEFFFDPLNKKWISPQKEILGPLQQIFSLNQTHWANSVIELPYPSVVVWLCGRARGPSWWKYRKKREKNGIGASIRNGPEIQCLPYAGFFFTAREKRKK